VTTLPTTYKMNPDRWNHLYLFFFSFFPDKIRFRFWDICRGPWYGPSTSLPSEHHLYFFLIFFSFYVFFILHSLNFHIWKCALNPENSTHHSLFFSDFPPILLLFFYFTQPHFPYLEMHTRPWNSSSTLSPCLLFFLWIFLSFIIIFYWKKYPSP